MKFTQILLAAPFLAGALAAPKAIVEGDDKAVCESQEGMKFMKGTCVTDLNCKNGKVMKMKDGDVKCVKKQSKKKNKNGKNKGGNKKGGNKKGGNKKGGNKKGGNKKNKEDKEEQKKQDKKDKMKEQKEQKMADRETWA